MPSKSEPRIGTDPSEKKPAMGEAELQDVKIKEEVVVDYQDERGGEEEEEEENNEEESSYPIDLPLEVITTIEPFNYAYPYLKNMSNGVLTHRNIFTEQEREVLRKIVDKYRDIVDTRSRTREIYMEKQSVWQQIVEEYNSTENILARTEKELKKCWDNMKYRAKQAEKEQQKVENLNVIRRSPDPHQIACSAVQAALEKMMSIQSHGGSGEDTSNGLGIGRDHHEDFSEETKENWNSITGSLDSDSKFSVNGDGDINLKNGDDPCNEDEDEDDQPVLKKARQESPKLSSILLGDAKKSSYCKSDSSTSRTHYTIPNCTKITHIKKKSKKSSSSNPVTILPKGFSSCVSIMNIPNPNTSANSLGSSSAATALELPSNGTELHSSGAISLGGGITISPQKTGTTAGTTHSSLVDTCSSSQMKPLPCLRKMMPTTSKGAKKGTTTKVSVNRILPYSSYDATPSTTDPIPDDGDRGFLEEKLLLQRLEFGSQEHALRMKVLEKQLQAYTNEAQFWALRTKLLKSGHQESSGKLMNGDVV